MQVSVEAGEGLQKHVTVSVPAEQVDQAVEKKLQSLARTVRMDGFRPGKVPMRVVKQRFGDQARQDAYGELIQSTYFEAITEQKLAPAGDPSIKLNEENEAGQFSYTATIEVMPEIKLNDLGELEIKRPVAEVTEEDVDIMIDRLRKQRTTWKEVDRPAQKGDTVHIDFKGFIDGEAFEGGAAEDVPLELGSGSMVPGFEDGLIGAKAGDEVKLEVSFPEDYRAEQLAGKNAVFEVKVNKVSEPQVPEIDEDFVKAFGVEDGTEASLRAEVRGNMERELKQKLKTMTKERVMEALLAANPVTVPKAMSQREAEVLKSQAMKEMADAGQSSSMDLPLSVFETQAERRVSLGLLINAVVSENNIELDQDKVKSTIDEFAQSYEQPQDVIDFYNSNKEQRAMVENLVLEEQVMDTVLDKAKTEDEPATFAGVVGVGG